jgi:hypothetical protein
MSHRHGTDFGGVGSRHGLKNTPAYAGKGLTNCEDGQRVGEERNEDEANQTGESDDESPSITETLTQETSQLQADDFSTIGCAGDAVLP